MATTDHPRRVFIDRPRPILAKPPDRIRRLAFRLTRSTHAAVPDLRRFARATARRWAVPEDPCDTLALVVSELVTNVVLHSGSPNVALLITFDGVALTVEVTDNGRWPESDARTPALAQRASFGRGLELVRACTSRCTVLPTIAGTRVTTRIPVT
ncbi:ATP-binding protein [Streptomyces lunaelactis]|uniref:ATP-binding protein n=1 Tax=Streptomyces lunaelactis TaxID=1535768 RepID=A0A2R4TD44_9ACTN|nr:ATP-binding protein [Streptomyces lunaelactis]AVZ77035.1 ATP-binding protein [Streptomyces lunaelactis]NUK85480.1 ATP-binding protein [Streptomyces lunaelactis]